MLSTLLCCVPPCPSRISGRGSRAPSGAQTIPGTRSPPTFSSKPRSVTPCSVVSEMNRIRQPPYVAHIRGISYTGEDHKQRARVMSDSKHPPDAGDRPATLHAIVRGRVQGVGFREYVVRHART